MARKKGKAVIEFGVKIAQMAEDLSEAAYLKLLVQMTRSFETTISRLQGFVKITKPEVLRLMKTRHPNNSEPEERFGPTHVEVIYDLSLGEDKIGQNKGYLAYEALCKLFGEKYVKKILKVEVVEIPAQTITRYGINPEKLDELVENKRFAVIVKYLAKNPSVKIGPVPKRVKRGEKRKRNSKKKES